MRKIRNIYYFSKQEIYFFSFPCGYLHILTEWEVNCLAAGLGIKLCFHPVNMLKGMNLVWL